MGRYFGKVAYPQEVIELSPPNPERCIIFDDYDWQNSRKGLHDLMVKMGFVRTEKNKYRPQYLHSSLALQLKFEFRSDGINIQRVELNSVVKIDRGFNEDIFQSYLRKEPSTGDFAMYCEMDRNKKVMLTTDGARLRQLKFIMTGADDSTNDVMMSMLFKVLSLNQCLGEVLTQNMIHMENGYNLEDSPLFASDIGLVETNFGLENMLNFDNHVQERLFDYIAPSLRYMSGTLNLERLKECLCAWQQLEVDGVLPPRDKWFPVEGADGLPHVLLHMARCGSRLNILDSFFECLDLTDPDEIRKWMGPSKEHATHIPLMFMSSFAKEQLVESFFHVIDKKINRKEICWEHEDQSLLFLMLDPNYFASKWKQYNQTLDGWGPQQTIDAWKIISLIDPSFQCVLTSKTTLPLHNFETQIKETVMRGGGVKIEKKGVSSFCYSNSTFRILPKNYDDYCWAFHPISNLEDLMLFFEELILENSKERGNSPSDISLEFASYSSSFILQHKLRNHFANKELKSQPPQNMGLRRHEINRF